MSCGGCETKDKKEKKKMRSKVTIVQESFDKIFEGRILSEEEMSEWRKKGLTSYEGYDIVKGLVLPNDYDYTIQPDGDTFRLIPLKKN